MLLKQGYLWKQGKIIKNWKKRYCVLLKKDACSFELRYFHRLESASPRGVIQIDGSTIVRWSENAQLPSLAIDIVTHGRTYIIYAENAEATTEWLTVLQGATQTLSLPA